MVKRYSGVIFLSFFYLIPLIGIAQNYSVKESATLVTDFLHEFFQAAPDHYLALNFSAPHGAFSLKRDDMTTIATTYDKNLRQIRSSPIKELGGKKYETALEFHGHLELFFSDQKRAVYKSEFDISKGGLTGITEELFTNPNENATYLKGFSRDSSYTFLLCKSFDKKGKDEAYYGVVMDKEMNVVTKFSFFLEGLREYIGSTACVLSDQGLLTIITGVRVKASKADFRPLQYLVTEVSRDGKSGTSQISDLPEGLLANMEWTARENGLSFTGLMAKTKKAGYTGVVTGDYSSSEKKISNIRETDFGNTAFFQNASEKYLKELAKEGIPAEANLVATYTLSDHAIILILETSETIVTSGSFSYMDTNSGNIYIVKINQKQEPDWVQIVPKKQQEPTSPIYTGTVSMPDGKDGVFIFFHDDERNEKLEGGSKAAGALLGGDWRHLHLAAVHVSADGNIAKKYIVDDYRADLLLAPAQPHTIYDHEIIYTSYNLKSLGRSTYRIGAIKVLNEK
jgi:hypothetical protein